MTLDDDTEAEQTADAGAPSPDQAGETSELSREEALEAERDQFKALAQRTQADFVNFKRRTDDERGNLARNASNQVVSRLLPIVDDFSRAVEALPEEAPAGWSDGVRLILQNLRALVQAEGVTAYEPAPGDTFDPIEHEAVYYQPTDEQPPGAVLTVVTQGYRSPDRILRPAQVVVAKEAPTGEGADS
jgi:molecular chaperone GrpE